MKISSNAVVDTNGEDNFPRKFSFTITQVSKLHKAFVNGSSANIKLAKTQLHKIEQSREILAGLLWSLLKPGLSLIGNVLKTRAKRVLIPLGITAVAPATDVAIHKTMFGSGMTTLTISNNEMYDIVKIFKSLEESGLLIKDVIERIKNEAKQNRRSIGMLLDTSVGSLLGNLLTGKTAIARSQGREYNMPGWGTTRAG